jgi:hypothetical protein
VDFFTAPTITFGELYYFFVIRRAERGILRFCCRILSKRRRKPPRQCVGRGSALTNWTTSSLKGKLSQVLERYGGHCPI